MGIKFELTERARNLDEKTKKIIKEAAPFFGKKNQRMVVDVNGGNFEQEIKLKYDLYFDGKYKGKYEQTLILKKNYNLIFIKDRKWFY